MDSLRKSVCRGLLEQTLQPIFLRTISAKDHLTLTAIAKKHQKSVAQVALRFLVQSGFVIIPRTTKAKHMQENLDVLTFTLDPDDMKRIESLDNAKSLFGWW